MNVTKLGKTSFIIMIGLCMILPAFRAHATPIIIAGDVLPENAVLFYDEHRNIVGAQVDDPNAPAFRTPIDPFNATEHLPSVEYQRNGMGVDVHFIERNGTRTSTRHIPFDELLKHYGSVERVERLLAQLDNQKQASETSTPGAIPEDTPDPIGPLGYWVHDIELAIREVYTNIAQIYSAPFLETHLRLKMITGTVSIVSVNGGSLSVEREVHFTSSSITDYYVSSAQTRTIQYMFDYGYDFWQ